MCKRPRTESQPLEAVTDSATTIPQLSNELTARVIEFLNGDSESLRNCALASHNLLHPARKLLHHHAFLNIRNSEKFLKVLHHSPQFGSYVRELHVFISNPMEQENSWVDRYLPMMTPKLPNVVHLELKGDKNGRYKAAAFESLDSVQRLSMLATQINDMNEFCAMLGMFPHLKTIYAHDLFVFRSPEIVVKPSNPSNVFRSFSFNSCRLDPGQIADWMIKHGLFVNAEYFSTCPLQQVGVPPVGKLLVSCGSALKHLKIALVGMKSQGGFVGESFTPPWLLISILKIVRRPHS